MTTESDISKEFTPAILVKQGEWKKARDILGGSRSAKANANRYLYQLEGSKNAIQGMANSAFIKMVGFFPAASKTLQAYMGLVNRVEPDFDTSKHEAQANVFNTITRSGLSIQSLANKVLEETISVNFCGLLVDHPAPTQDAISVKNAFQAGYRPFITFYKAEQIQVVEEAVVNSRVEYWRIVVRDDEDHYREMFMRDGFYRVIIHTRDPRTKTFVKGQEVTPLLNGRPLAEIPFVLVSLDEDSSEPKKAPLDDLIDHNIALWQADAQLATCNHFCSMPAMVFTNIEQQAINWAAGNALFLPTSPDSATPSVQWLEFSGAGVQALERNVDKIKDECAALGSRVLASEKAAVEAAETHVVRRSSEFATLAMIATVVSRKISEAMVYVAAWLNVEPITFMFNRDFIPAGMNPQEIASVLALYQAGTISIETLHAMLSKGEALPPGFDSELEIDRLNSTVG